MAIIKNPFPILEYDDEKDGVIKPNWHKRFFLPEVCLMTFFGEVLEKAAGHLNAEIKHRYDSEVKVYPIYVLNYRGVELCMVQVPVGPASAAMMTDYLVGYGIKKIIACGGCCVLDDIPAGGVIIPVAALRDEGASYHYLPPSREITLDEDVVSIIKSTLNEHNVPFTECKTWTTDGFYRETPDMIAYRREEGCRVVEMECAAMAAVARFRGIKFGQLLYSGDILFDSSGYDDREWYNNRTAREKLFFLALETAVKLSHA